MRRARPPTPHKRDGIWYLIRRVPKDFQHLDRREIVRVTTEIAVADDPRAVRAKPIVEALGRELEAYWRGLRDGQSAEGRLRLEAAQKRARKVGLLYQPAEALAAGPLDEILKRVNLLLERNEVDDDAAVAAVLGGEGKPVLRLSDLVREFEAIQSTQLRDYSAQQVKKWRAPRDMAVAVFIDIVGDVALHELTREHGLQFRAHWQKRIVADGIDIGTANTVMGALAKMLRAVEIVHQLGITDIFRGLRFDGEVDKHRAAFTVQHVQDVLFADGALDGLNAEARAIVYLCAETGLRLSEASSLLPERIVLDHDVPHVQIRPDGRKLKTAQSERDVPLVGAALAVMKLHPGGFPRYRDKNASLSAVVNKYLDAHKMLPSDNHSLYSLRHTFEDRLTAVEAPEKVIAALMGHKYSRPKYGAGPSLAQKLEWLERIALKPPAHFGPRG